MVQGLFSWFLHPPKSQPSCVAYQVVRTPKKCYASAAHQAHISRLSDAAVVEGWGFCVVGLSRALSLGHGLERYCGAHCDDVLVPFDHQRGQIHGRLQSVRVIFQVCLTVFDALVSENVTLIWSGTDADASVEECDYGRKVKDCASGEVFWEMVSERHLKV